MYHCKTDTKIQKVQTAAPFSQLNKHIQITMSEPKWVEKIFALTLTEYKGQNFTNTWVSTAQYLE